MKISQVALFLVATTLVGGGCKERKATPRTSRSPQKCRCGADASTPLALRNLHDDAGAAARPGPVRRAQHFTLLAAAQGYRNHRSCVASVHSSLPPELTREADQANLSERICQTRRALAEKRPALCEEIDDPFWPRACRRLYAVLYGKPDECPVREVRAQGRDGLCVALASRDASLCRAVRSAGGRQRCSAILGSASLCRGMRTTAEVASCQLDRKRWRAVLRPARPSLGPKYAPKYALTVTEGGRTTRGVSAALDLGLVLPRGASGRWILGDLRATARRAKVERELQLMVDLPAPGKMPATLKAGNKKTGARFCALWKGRPVPSSRIQGTLKLTRHGARRGARVVGSYAVRLDIKDGAIDVTGSFDTFVRDVVPGTWARVTCADRLAEASPARAPAAPKADPSAPTDTGERPCFFVAHWQGLRQLGYRVYGVRPKAACARLGLRNGDVVLAVGSRGMTRWADVVSLYGRLAGKKPLAVRVLRKGRKLSLKRAGR